MLHVNLKDMHIRTFVNELKANSTRLGLELSGERAIHKGSMLQNFLQLMAALERCFDARFETLYAWSTLVEGGEVQW